MKTILTIPMWIGTTNITLGNLQIEINEKSIDSNYNIYCFKEPPYLTVLVKKDLYDNKNDIMYVIG